MSVLSPVLGIPVAARLRLWRHFFLLLLLSFLCASHFPVVAQQPAESTPSNGSRQESSGEMAVKDEATTDKVSESAKVRVNVRLVLARVVVRDATGHAIGNLHKEDFELSDNGKKQLISAFDAEHIAAAPSAEAANSTAAPDNTSRAVQKAADSPARYVAYVFDDLRLEFGDLARVREAAQKRIDGLAASDRVAIYSTSGQTLLDFTDDRSKLHQALDGLRPRPMQVANANQCPEISFYKADLIVNKNDPQVLQAVVDDYLSCQGPVATSPSGSSALIANASTYVQSMARSVLTVGQEESRTGLRFLHDAVARMSALPGQRSLVLVSPGFLTADLDYEYNELIDRALRAQVTINCMDARGLYVVIAKGKASQPGQALLDIQSASAESDILAVLANSTGGTFFQNNNDMNEGLRRVSDAPEFGYVLGFKPQNLKPDGRFHTLKVSLTNHQKYDLQSRRGYYAPRHDVDAAEEAKREIEDEVFSNEQLHDLPVALHTQFFKPPGEAATLTVLAHVDVKRLHYKQVQDRNQNDLTVVTAVFDRNGNFLQSNQKLVQMRWKSETLQAKLGSGITLKASFDVKPGRYLVRVVARDSDQQLMSAENGTVEIP
jgi:VWFA-related protein